MEPDAEQADDKSGAGGSAVHVGMSAVRYRSDQPDCACFCVVLAVDRRCDLSNAWRSVVLALIRYGYQLGREDLFAKLYLEPRLCQVEIDQAWRHTSTPTGGGKAVRCIGISVADAGRLYDGDEHRRTGWSGAD